MLICMVPVDNTSYLNRIQPKLLPNTWIFKPQKSLSIHLDR